MLEGLKGSAVCALLVAAAVSGCAHGLRFSAITPGVNQAVRVASGDSIFFEMEENATAGLLWDFTCDDPDVEVSMDHAPSGESGALGSVRVKMHIHRGYDGPSVVTFALKRSGAAPAEKRFTVTLFKRVGDAAFWE